MRYLLILFLMTALNADIRKVRDQDQTFINDCLLGKGLIFEIMAHNLDAVKCVDGNKVYLKPERIIPSDQGLMLVCEDDSLLLLPKVYSDSFGCFMRSALICTNCTYQYKPDAVPIGCPQCRSGE